MGLKIAVVTPWGKLTRCGIRSYSEALTSALAKQGVESYIVRLPRFGDKTPEIVRNVAESVPAGKVDLISVQHEYGLYMNLESHFYTELRRHGLPIVTTLHAVGVIGSTDVYVTRNSSRVIVHNKHCARILRREGYRNPFIIPHGCDFKPTIPREEARAKYSIPPQAKIVGYVGYLSEYKGLEILIEACSRIRDAYLLIGGGWHVTGPEPENVTHLKMFAEQRMPSRYEFTGFVPDEDLPSVYGAMDCVGYCSHLATESGALLMALSHGKAVVSSPLPPFKEKEAVGALVTYRNSLDLTAKLNRLLNDEVERKRLEDGAKRYAEENSWDAVAKRHICFFEQVLRQKKAR